MLFWNKYIFIFKIYLQSKYMYNNNNNNNINNNNN